MKHDDIRHRDCLHWLPVPQHIQLKLYLVMFKPLHGLALICVGQLYQLTADEAAIRHSQQPRHQLSCHKRWHPLVCCNLEPAAVTYTCDPLGRLLENCSKDILQFPWRVFIVTDFYIFTFAVEKVLLCSAFVCVCLLSRNCTVIALVSSSEVMCCIP